MQLTFYGRRVPFSYSTQKGQTMKTTNDFLNDLKPLTETGSDYAIAKLLGVTRGAVHNYRKKKNFFNDDVCIKVGELLEIAPAEIILAVQAERTKSSEAKQSIEQYLAKIGSVAAAVLIGLSVIVAQPEIINNAVIAGNFSDKNSDYVYYVKLRLYRKTLYISNI